MYCQLHHHAEHDGNAKLNHVVAVISDIHRRGAAQKKDFWDKLSASATVVSGLVLGGLGMWVTNSYNSRALSAQQSDDAAARKVERVEIVQKFFPHLVSESSAEQRGALLAIAALGDEKLATELAQNFSGKGSVDALKQLAGSSDPQVAEKANVALDAALLAEKLSAATLRVKVSEVDRAGQPSSIEGTGFVVSERGSVVTAAHLFDDDAVDRKILASFGDVTEREVFPAELAELDQDKDIAVLQLNLGAKNTLPKLKLQTVKPKIGSEVFATSFRARSSDLAKLFVRGMLFSFDGPEGQWIDDIPTGPGASGSPVTDSEGKVIGYLVGSQFDKMGIQVGAMVRPMSDVSEVIERALSKP